MLPPASHLMQAGESQQGLLVRLIWITCHVYVRELAVNDAPDNDALFKRLQTKACGIGGHSTKLN